MAHINSSFLNSRKRIDEIVASKDDVANEGRPFGSFFSSISNSLSILRNDLQAPRTTDDECQRWIKVLYDAENFGATDPRDRIYAMFTLADSTVQVMKGASIYRTTADESYGADYTKSVLTSYTGFALNLIERTDHLGLLWFYEKRSLTEKRPSGDRELPL